MDAGKADHYCMVINDDAQRLLSQRVANDNLKRPRRYDRRLLRACYLSALVSIRTDPSSRTYYDRKRTEGKRHTQAVLALARRRLNVLWAMLRDHAVYHPATTTAAA
ncbi:hypothetical protein RE97_21935 [Mycobacterium avium subsp. paratuberculosis]|nr:hypothetical protein RE97_21935 [Mycobacterium avium subsp. paratuberculosis]